jgi:hypothetical protein
MTLKPNLFAAGVIAGIHFGATVITSLAAAGQSDSLGQPHDYGWIVSSDILAFPLSVTWETFQRHFSFSDGVVMPILFIQSLCWGVVISMLFSPRRKVHRDTNAA